LERYRARRTLLDRDLIAFVAGPVLPIVPVAPAFLLLRK